MGYELDGCLRLNFVSDDMTIHIYMFGALMKHQIIDDMDGIPVVRVYVKSFFVCWMSRSWRRYINHCSSHVALAKVLYSTSEDDQDTMFFFLCFHEIIEVARLKQNLVVDHLISGHDPQSESIKPINVILLDVLKMSPCADAYLM